MITMEDRKALFERLEARIVDILEGSGDREARMGAICRLLRDEVEHYDWVGFYLVNPARKRMLRLGPYEGAPTEHTDIAFGQGICGQAADRGETFIVPNVAKENNYLSCNPRVRSEIVVVMARDGNILGELDIDSHRLNPFTSEDRRFLERVAGLVARIL